MKKETVHTGGNHWRKSLAVTLILILVMIIMSIFVVRWINHMEEDYSFERLYEEAAALSQDMQIYAKNDREQLEILSTLISGYDDPASPELWRLLSSYDSIGMASDIALLLPDNTVITGSGQRIDAEGKISFEKESALGAHISNRETSLTDEEEYVVRHYVPVIKDGETTAMLYGVIELNRLPEEIKANPYGGKAAIYMIEGNSGDFLLDTWHDEPGNIWDLGEREMAPGYDHEQLKQGLIDGESAYVVFVSQTTGEYLYFYYTPLPINDWRLALSVPEDVVFARAGIIEKVLNIFLIVEIICFVLYFLWMLRYTRIQTGEKQKQLDMLSHIYDVEKLLFNAHEQKSNIMLALEKIARITSAEKAAFWMVPQPENDTDDTFFIWKSAGKEHSADDKELTSKEKGLTPDEKKLTSDKNPKPAQDCGGPGIPAFSDDIDDIPGMSPEFISDIRIIPQNTPVPGYGITALPDYFRKGHTHFETHDTELIRKFISPRNEASRAADTQVPTEDLPKSIMAVPVETPDGEICGILSACNMSDDRANVVLLKNMSFSFSMLCHNIRIHAAMKEQGERDSLTGLYNRNRYESDLTEYRDYSGGPLTCVYIDVNGLHELNNTQGHKAGDIMLKSVADQIRQMFGSSHTYRIGGDEFVTFIPETEADVIEKRCLRIKTELAKSNYHISVGTHREEQISSIEDLIKAAEKKMYDEKRKYYENTSHDRRRKARILVE